MTRMWVTLFKELVDFTVCNEEGEQALSPRNDKKRVFLLIQHALI